MKITNLQSGKEVAFGTTYRLSGMNWGRAAATHTTTQGSGQIGTTTQCTIISGREIVVTGYILMNGNSGIEKRRQLISAVVNPLHILRVEHNGYKIEGKPKSTIEWASNYKDNNRDHAKFTFTVYCEYPYFTAAADLITEVALWLPRFRFPLALNFAKKTLFAERQKDLIVNVDNPGDVPVGIVAYFSAKGSVLNPSIQNIETREYIKVMLTMEAGDLITINTNYGRKNEAKLTRANTETNILDYLDIGSDYEMQLEVGANLIKYDADANVDSLSVRIKRAPAISTMPMWGVP